METSITQGLEKVPEQGSKDSCITTSLLKHLREYYLTGEEVVLINNGDLSNPILGLER